MKSDDQAISAICFDAFGTLIRHGEPRLNPYQRLIPSRKMTQDERLMFLTRNVSVATLARELGVSDMLSVIRRELDEEIAGLQLFPEVESVLTSIRKAGKKIAICSNLATEYGSVVHHLLPDLDAYVFSYETGAAKPDPAIYHAVCEALQCPPPKLLFVGDSIRCDLNGPNAFGIQASWLNRRGGYTLVDAVSKHLVLES